MSKKTFLTGCSGFHYKSWKGKFYPGDLPEKEWLSYYADRFPTVEINNSFYSLPGKDTLKNWKDQTPRDFCFTLKGSRYITHMKKLKADDSLKKSLTKFYDTAFILKSKLRCVLWQLPGNLHRDDDKLREFCGMLSGNVLNCIEFRHGSWLDEEVFKILDDSGTGFCIVSSPDDSLKSITSVGKLAYFRFHGENEKGKWYDYKYSEKELDNWAKEMKNSSSSTVFAYFNNDMHANAPQDAGELMSRL